MQIQLNLSLILFLDYQEQMLRRFKKKLEKENVMIHFPDSYVPEDRTVIIHGHNMDGHVEGHN